MDAPSGLINCYGFFLSMEVEDPVVSKIYLFTDRADLSRNYVVLDVFDYLKNPASITKINDYVRDRLQRFGAQLLTTVIVGESGEENKVPCYIDIPNYRFAREVIDDLFRHREMSGGRRADIELALREFESSVMYAEKRVDYITKAQKDVVRSVISPYTKDVKAAKLDIKEVKEWIHSAISLLGKKKDMRFELSRRCGLEGEKEEAFYDSLFGIAHVCASRANMESTFERLGNGGMLPSTAMIEKTVLNKLINPHSKDLFALDPEDFLDLDPEEDIFDSELTALLELDKDE